MADSKRQRIARIRERVTKETYQQALVAVTAGGVPVPGLSPEYSFAISRDYRKGGYTALWACPECETEGVLNLRTLPVLHRLLTAEQRENAIAAMTDAHHLGDEAAVRKVLEDVNSLCTELKVPRINATWLCLVCTSEYGESEITDCQNCGQLTTDTELGVCGWCWDL